MKTTLVLIFTLLSLSSCGSSQRVTLKEKNLPEWYLHPLKSNTMELYALGEGKDKKEAVTKALSFLAETLSVSISSTYRAKTVVKEGSHYSKDSTYESDIKSEVKTIRISHYLVVEEKSLGFKRYAVLIKVDKNQLFLSMKKELDQEFFLLQEGEKELKNSDALHALAFLAKQKSNFENLESRLLVMSVLRTEFNTHSYIQKRERLKEEYKRVLDSISFEVRADSNSKGLSGVLSKGLSAKGFKISETAKKNHFILYVNAEILKTQAYGFTLARTAIKFTTKNSEGSIVGSNSINLVGQSSQGFGVAKQNLSIQLNELMQKEGVGKLLNLPI
jgi:hypothetical protein